MSKRVFVLGAGFTKAFAPEMPLMQDNYSFQINAILEKLGNYKQVRTLLRAAQEGGANNLVDVERLFTRLEVGMPYDVEQGVNHELGLCLSELKVAFFRRIEAAKEKVDYGSLGIFADHCVATGSTCITFNYDDLLDEAIWVSAQRRSKGNPYRFWAPDGGYGFFCKPSTSCIQSEGTRHVDVTAIRILKLHGSLNWRIRRGFIPPYPVDAVVHHEKWFKPEFRGKLIEADKPTIETLILDHLQSDAFIVPPILAKVSLVDQPILRLVWDHAYRALAAAEEIIFIGYSMPISDIAAGFLFTEPLVLKKPKVLVINLCEDSAKQSELESRYKRSLPRSLGIHFENRDAREWVKELSSEEARPGQVSAL